MTDDEQMAAILAVVKPLGTLDRLPNTFASLDALERQWALQDCCDTFTPTFRHYHCDVCQKSEAVHALKEVAERLRASETRGHSLQDVLEPPR